MKILRYRHFPLIIFSLILLFFVFYNLNSFPTTWFDEGSHLHVPKTLIQYGKYADRSSDGFRYYGPTVGVGPTVLLPIALMFKLFGVGLLQARLIIVFYLIGTVISFYYLSKLLGNGKMALIATALLVATRSVNIIENGRQVLGEVPGLFFMVVALFTWYKNIDNHKWSRLALVGVLFGLAIVTKYQNLIVLIPALGIIWVANLIYYRTLRQRTIIIPAIIALFCFILWQVILIRYLGPATSWENFQSLRVATSGAALVFSSDLIKQSMQELVSSKVYFGWMIPALIFGLVISLDRSREGLKWGFLLLIILINLIWYVLASIGWIRYAFVGLVFSSMFVARFFYELTEGYKFNIGKLWENICHKHRITPLDGVRISLLVFLIAMISIPLLQTAKEIVFPPFNAPFAMADYLDENIPKNILIETWEPEIGFLTDHNYHYPPQLLLNDAVQYIWTGGPPPSEYYTFMQTDLPKYLLIGEFAKWVNLYPTQMVEKYYSLETKIGPYELFIQNN